MQVHMEFLLPISKHESDFVWAIAHTYSPKRFAILTLGRWLGPEQQPDGKP